MQTVTTNEGQEEERLEDPVCGMKVRPSRAAGSHEHGGTTYWFCGKNCLAKFSANPDAYVKKAEAPPAPAPAPADAEWVCPMDPDVIEHAPGPCRKCGMALELRMPQAGSGPSAELVDMQRRFWVSLPFALATVTLAMSAMVPSLSMHAAGWIELALATPVVAWGGKPLLERAWRSIATRQLNMFTLIGIGITVAYVYSLVAVVAPRAFPPAMRDGGVHEYFEAAASITVLVLLGQVLELRARARTGDAIRALLGLTPKTARRLTDRGEEDVPLDVIRAGDRLRVRAGEKVPVDGSVIEGQSAVDESMITGEAIPIEKTKGSSLTAGTLNGTGALVMKAERVGEGTLLAQIVKVVSEAQRSQPPIQRLADRVAAYFVPAVLAAAVVTFAVWLARGPEPRAAHALVNAVAVLIIACPCALGLATPMSIMVGVARAARGGVLFRNATALETLCTIDTLVIDKTGTLTEGRARLEAAAATNAFGEQDVLRFAAIVERASEHALASAITRAADERYLAHGDARDVKTHPGKGIVGVADGRTVAVGNEKWMAEIGVDASPLLAKAEAWCDEGNTVVFVAIDGALAGILALRDPVKPSARAAVRALHDGGVRVIMLTGDTRINASAVARSVGIDEVHAEVLPTQKGEVVRRLQSQGRAVAMAGDGINDAPALAEARVGIAMGTGTDVAMQSAGVILVKGDLAGIQRARALSRATMRNIRENLFFAFVYNALGIPIAAGVLYPFFGLLLSPMIASAAMSLSSVTVIGNALRLRAMSLTT